MYTYTYIHIHIYLYTCIRIYVYTYVRIYVYTYRATSTTWCSCSGTGARCSGAASCARRPPGSATRRRSPDQKAPNAPLHRICVENSSNLCGPTRTYHGPQFTGICVKNMGYGFVEFEVSNRTISTVFRHPLKEWDESVRNGLSMVERASGFAELVWTIVLHLVMLCHMILHIIG